jgi:hypothetical protein
VKEDPSDSELREKLAAWRVESRLPDDFQQRVWKRIAVREARIPVSLGRLDLSAFRSSVKGFPFPGWHWLP